MLFRSQWSWTLCSNGVDPLAVRDARADAIEPGSEIYHRELHRAAAVLPSYLRRLVGR